MEKPRVMHFRDAMALLESGQPCDIRVWKLSDGSIINYRDVVCVSAYRRGGTHTISIPSSGLLREFRDVAMFEINGYRIYR